MTPAPQFHWQSFCGIRGPPPLINSCMRLMKTMEKKLENHVFGEPKTSAPTPLAYIVYASPTVRWACIPNIVRFSGINLFLSGWKRGIVRVRSQPPEWRLNPAFPLANSLGSPVDRSRLLTGSSNTGSHFFPLPTNSSPTIDALAVIAFKEARNF